MSSREERIVQMLQAKRREDPEGFREYLPDVVKLLPEPAGRRDRTRSPFGLTERELSYHREGLAELMSKQAEGMISSEQAIDALRHCANLIRDDNLPEEAGYEALKGLIKSALGKSPGSYKSNTTVPIEEGGPVLERVSAVRGVCLELDREGRMVSVSIQPRKVRERRKLMEMVGAASAEASPWIIAGVTARG